MVVPSNDTQNHNLTQNNLTQQPLESNIQSNYIPPLDSKFPSENIQDASNQELLDSINQKKDTIKKFTSPKNNIQDLKTMNNQLQNEINIKLNNVKEKVNTNTLVQPETQEKIKEKVEKVKNTINEKPKETKIEMPKLNLFKECNFYSDKCPSGFNDFGSIGLTGLDKNVMLSCGNVENTKPAVAIAKIKNNSLDEIIVIDKGHGYNPQKPPAITIVGGKGNGGHAEAIIDDDGYLKLIKIIHPGNYYTETPNVIIEPPYMNSNCHFCCKINN